MLVLYIAGLALLALGFLALVRENNKGFLMQAAGCALVAAHEFLNGFWWPAVAVAGVAVLDLGAWAWFTRREAA